MNIDTFNIALLHYPVYNKRGDIVTTAVTNMDIHDISRAAKSYGIERFYIVTPIKNQHQFVKRILRHWQEGYGSTYNPSRKEAFDVVHVKSTLKDVVQDISGESNGKVHIITTSAASRKPFTTYKDLKEIILKDRGNYLLIFGTGWGMADDVIRDADFLLEPIKGPTDYNHLSVRSAVSISLDRLFGKS
jgi:hypothetical protein